MNSSPPRSRGYIVWTFLLFILVLWGITLAIAACQDDWNPVLNSSSEPEPTDVASDTNQESESIPTESQSTPAATGTPAADPTATPELEPTPNPTDETDSEPTPTPEPEPTEPPDPTPEPEPLDIPSAAFLPDMTHMYQTLNNCSAASVCMLMSHYDVVLDQEALRPHMRPNDNARHGKYEYIVDYIREQGFNAELMHGGDVETLKAFLAHDIPVIVQQWLELEGDPIGHYRVVRGYDDDPGIFRVNDSMNGEDVHYSYADFNQMWRAFSYRFIPVYPPEQQELVDQILGEERDHDVNRQRTAERIEAELEERPEDAELWYSLGTNLFDLGRDEEAIQAYERAVSIGLPPKMLWYVYWPPAAYNNVGRHEDAIRIAEAQVSSAGTFGEMRYERGRAHEALGETELAIAEYRQALNDDPKLERAEEALARLGAQ